MLELFLNLIAYSIYLMLILGFYISYKSKEHYRYMISVILTFLVSDAMKLAFKIPRPNPSFEGYSFPSNHASVSFSAAFYLPRYFYLWAILVSVVRILQGVHRLEDIVFGWILGTFISYVVSRTEINLQLIYRKIIHVLLVFFHYFLYLLSPQIVLDFIILEMVLFPILTEKIEILKKIKTQLKYEWEKSIYPLGVFTLLSGLLIIFIFSKNPLPLVIVLAFSDTLSILGNSSKIKIFKKPSLGILLGSVLTFTIYSIFYNLGFGILAAIIFAIAELTPIDNLLIPATLIIAKSLYS